VTAAGADPAAIRIERGNPDAEELAAITVILLARAAAAAAAPAPAHRRATAGWRLLERALRPRDPRGWRAPQAVTTTRTAEPART
jgi:hypothetical protein